MAMLLGSSRLSGAWISRRGSGGSRRRSSCGRLVAGGAIVIAAVAASPGDPAENGDDDNGSDHPPSPIISGISGLRTGSHRIFLSLNCRIAVGHAPAAKKNKPPGARQENSISSGIKITRGVRDKS